MTSGPDFIHEFVPGTSNRTLLLLHGTGGNERDLIALGRELDPNAALLSPRGKVLENGMPRFFRRLAEGVFDLEDLKHRTNELADFVIAAAQHYGFASDNSLPLVILTALTSQRVCYCCGQKHCLPQSCFERWCRCIRRRNQIFRPFRVWIGAGTNDPIIPISETKALAELLRNAGADVTIPYFQAAHELTMADVESAREWLTLLR